MFDDWGKGDPRRMPTWHFHGGVHLDYASAVRADITKQEDAICPRYWYIDATMACIKCGKEFCFTTTEQKLWYEDLQFSLSSFPKHCLGCRKALRNLKKLRKEYDRDIADGLRGQSIEAKERLAAVIDGLCEAGEHLPERIHGNRRLLARQIARIRSQVPG